MAQRFNPPFGTGGKTVTKQPMAKGVEPGGHSEGMYAEDQEPEQVAEEHGPAHEVHIEHDHEMGVHHVHSMHQDGHEHHSDHESAEKAHEHGKKLAMVESHKEPDGDETGHDEEEPWGKE